MRATITVPGRPVPKARTRGGQRRFLARGTRLYQEAIAWQARADRVRFGEALLEVTIELWSETGLRGDLDNYAKSILDGLEAGGALENDRQVVSLTIRQIVGAGDKTVIHLQTMDDLRAEAS